MSIIISIVSLLISLFTCIYNVLCKRKRISISILEYNYRNDENQFLLSIENCSHLPISISRILVTIDNRLYECQKIPTVVKRIEHIEYPKIRIEEISSLSNPIALDSLGGLSGYVVFPKSPEIFENQDTLVNFQLYTNRGKIKSLKVPLDRNCCLHTS